MASFSPIVGGQPKILILGSMPSQTSLRESEYYANPQNSFWWIMSNILGFAHDADYCLREQFLIQAGVAVWDVLLDCQRPGSLDSSIVRASESPNDLVSFLQANRSVELIGFNGGAAKTIFMRHCSNVLAVVGCSNNQQLKAIQLPSTSPAYASMKKQDKLEVWSQALVDYL